MIKIYSRICTVRNCILRFRILRLPCIPYFECVLKWMCGICMLFSLARRNSLWKVYLLAVTIISPAIFLCMVHASILLRIICKLLIYWLISCSLFVYFASANLEGKCLFICHLLILCDLYDQLILIICDLYDQYLLLSCFHLLLSLRSWLPSSAVFWL